MIETEITRKEIGMTGVEHTDVRSVRRDERSKGDEPGMRSTTMAKTEEDIPKQQR